MTRCPCSSSGKHDFQRMSRGVFCQLCGEPGSDFDESALTREQIAARARIERDKGMARATDHADREDPGWGEHAYAFLRRYMRQHAHFQTTDVRIAARGIVTDPPDARAWGFVVKRAVREGRLLAGKYEPVNSIAAHRRPMVIWHVADGFDV